MHNALLNQPQPAEGEQPGCEGVGVARVAVKKELCCSSAASIAKFAE